MYAASMHNATMPIQGFINILLAYFYQNTTFLNALCRTKFSPVTRFLVDTWMSTVKPVYKNVFYDLKWTTNT